MQTKKLFFVILFVGLLICSAFSQESILVVVNQNIYNAMSSGQKTVLNNYIDTLKNRGYSVLPLEFYDYSFEKNGKGILITGNDQVDKLNKKFEVYEIERVFKDINEPTTRSYSKIKKEMVEVPDLFSIFKMKLKKDVNEMEAVNKYKNITEVEWAEPNYIYKNDLVSINDPDFRKQYGLTNIHDSETYGRE